MTLSTLDTHIEWSRRCLVPWHIIRLDLLEEYDAEAVDYALALARQKEALQLDHTATLTTGLAASIRRDLDTLEALQESDPGGKSLLDLLKLRQSLRKELADLYHPSPQYDGASAGAALSNLAADYGSEQ